MTYKIPFVCQQGQLKPKDIRLEQEALAGGGGGGGGGTKASGGGGGQGTAIYVLWRMRFTKLRANLLLRWVYCKCAAIGNEGREGQKALSWPLCQELQRHRRCEILRWYPTDITWCTQNHGLGLWNKLVMKLQQNKNNDNHFTLHNNILVCEWVIPAFPTLPSGM